MFCLMLLFAYFLLECCDRPGFDVLRLIYSAFGTENLSTCFKVFLVSQTFSHAKSLTSLNEIIQGTISVLANSVTWESNLPDNHGSWVKQYYSKVQSGSHGLKLSRCVWSPEAFAIVYWGSQLIAWETQKLQFLRVALHCLAFEEAWRLVVEVMIPIPTIMCTQSNYMNSRRHLVDSNVCQLPTLLARQRGETLAVFSLCSCVGPKFG